MGFNQKGVNVTKNTESIAIKKIILKLEPELRLIMPGKDSIYHKTLTESLRNLIIECKQ